MKFLRISIFTAMERNEAISRVRQVIGACGGWIVDHALLSNLAATINFEVPAGNAGAFVAKLREAEFKPEIDGDLPRGDKGGEAGDLRGQVSLSFIHQEADMRRDVPPFG